MACIGRDDRRQALDEDLAAAGDSITEEAAHLQLQGHGDALPGQVGDAAHVVGMDTGRWLAAHGTGCLRGGGPHVCDDPLGRHGKPEEVESGDG